MNEKLANALRKPMTHISDVRRCFNLCATEEDVEEVIGRIPSMFGLFTAEFTDDETFIITNIYCEDGCDYEEEAEYEFYVEGEEDYYV